jgi:hypothetical protein
MALYRGDSEDPVFRGWLKKVLQITFRFQGCLTSAGQQEGSGATACPSLELYDSMRRGTSRVEQRVGRLPNGGRYLCERFNIWFLLEYLNACFRFHRSIA